MKSISRKSISYSLIKGCRFQGKCDFKGEVKMWSKVHQTCSFHDTCNQKTEDAFSI